MEGEEILNPGTPTADVVYSYSYSGGGGSSTTLEAHDDDGVVLLVPGPGASSAASTDGPPATYSPDLTTSPTTRSNVPYTDWTTAAHGARLPAVASVVPSQTQSVVGEYAYPDVVMAIERSGSSHAPATRTSMLMAHLSSDMYPANVAYDPGAVTTPSAATNGPGGLNHNAVTATPDTNAVGFGYTIGMADSGSERLHPAGTGTAAAAAATEPPGGGYYYNNNSAGMAFPFAAPGVDEAEMEGLVADAVVSQDDQVAGAEPVRGGLGGLGLAATSLATAGLIAGGVDTPVIAIALFGMLLAGVILVTVRVFRA